MALPPWWILHDVNPAGPERDKGTWRAISYTQEQQGHFGVDINGEVTDHEQHGNALESLGSERREKPRPMPNSAAAALVGGAQDSEVDAELRALVARVQDDFERIAREKGRLGDVEEFEPVQVLVQVVTGRNYFVKVHLGGGEYAFLRIYDRFGDVSLEKVRLGLKDLDPIAYF